MFKLFNNYPLHKLLQKVKWNARAMFIVYALFIGVGITSAFMIIKKDNFLLLFPIFIAGGLSLFAPFLLYDYFHNKKNEYSIFTLSNQGFSILDILDEEIIKCEKIGDRFGISKEYLFSMKSTFYIPFAIPTQDIKTVYFFKYPYWQKAGMHLHKNTCIYIITKQGLRYKLPFGAKYLMKSKSTDEWILSRIHVHAPEITLGYKFHLHKNSLVPFTDSG